MSEPSPVDAPKRKITLKLAPPSFPAGTITQSSITATPTAMTPGGGVPPAGSPPPQTPISAGGSRIKLNIKKSVPPTPSEGLPSTTPMGPPPPATTEQLIAARAIATPAVKKTKAGRTPKPSAKRRAKDAAVDSDDEDAPLMKSSGNAGPKPKKIKVLATPAEKPSKSAPRLKVRSAGNIPQHPPGDGYDSEAEDREVDPVIEEQFILRMMPGEHCDYLRKMIQERKVGLPPKQGGADVQMKWLDQESKRCVITILGQPYAAVLLDLPTITESMKTWDKKQLVKSADICQMLLVLGKVKTDEEAKTYGLPPMVEHGHRWPHGLTPPMHDCIHRRFRKRLSKLEIQNKEAEVDRLLKADKDAQGTKWEIVDDRASRTNGVDDDEDAEFDEDEDGEADAEGEIEEAEDYFGPNAGEYEEPQFDEDELMAEFEASPGNDGIADTPADTQPGATPAALAGEATTPGTAQNGTPAADESAAEGDGNDLFDDDDDDEEEDGEDIDNGGYDDDGDDEEGADEVKGVREDIKHMKSELKKLTEQMESSGSVIMKNRLQGKIKSLKAELELKMSSIGYVDEDDS